MIVRGGATGAGAPENGRDEGEGGRRERKGRKWEF